MALGAKKRIRAPKWTAWRGRQAAYSRARPEGRSARIYVLASISRATLHRAKSGWPPGGASIRPGLLLRTRRSRSRLTAPGCVFITFEPFVLYDMDSGRVAILLGGLYGLIKLGRSF